VELSTVSLRSGPPVLGEFQKHLRLAAALRRRRDADLRLPSAASRRTAAGACRPQAVRAARRDKHRHRYKEEAPAWTAMAAEPVVVRVELAEGVEHDQIGGRVVASRGLRLLMSPTDESRFSTPEVLASIGAVSTARRKAG
jgi:hypothetical protein